MQVVHCRQLLVIVCFITGVANRPPKTWADNIYIPDLFQTFVLIYLEQEKDSAHPDMNDTQGEPEVGT
jgi:hypothetical protein